MRAYTLLVVHMHCQSRTFFRSSTSSELRISKSRLSIAASLASRLTSSSSRKLTSVEERFHSGRELPGIGVDLSSDMDGRLGEDVADVCPWLVIMLETPDVRAEEPGESSSFGSGGGGGAFCLSFLRNSAAVFIFGLVYGELSGLPALFGGQEGPFLGTSGGTTGASSDAGGGLAVAAPRNLRTPFIANVA